MRSVTIGKSRILALVAGLMVAGPVAAWATPSSPTPISIVNPSFEAATTPSGRGGPQDYYFIGSFTGWAWNGVSYGGWFHPSTVEYPGGGNVNTAATGIPNGSQVGFVNGGATLGQTLTSNLVSNASYTLSFAVGRRADFALPSSYSVELLAGGSVLATWSSADNTPPSAGSFVPETLTFSSATVNAAHAGQSLGILMLTSGSTSQQANFDNFSLNVVTGVSAIPEPTAGGLLLIALIGIAAVRREWT